MKGYQVIEQYSFAQKIYDAKIPGEVLPGILAWIVCRLRAEESLRRLPVEIDLIPVTYYGTYPAIGVHYKEEGIEDCETIINNLVDKYFREFSLGQFFDSFLEQSSSIKEVLSAYNK